MEKQIKFRHPILNSLNGQFIKWHYWGFVEENNGFIGPAEPKPNIQHRFTGLDDKQGKEIWEGDIFQVAGNKIYEVRFISSIESNHEWYYGTFILHSEQALFPFDEYAMQHGKVIGNTIENPELMRVGH